MIDFDKLNTIGEIKNAQENGKYIFTDEERDLFVNNLLTDIKDARKAAKLLVRIKTANAKKQKDAQLLSDLEDEKDFGNRGSVSYRVLNVNNLIRNTIDRLVFLGRTDLPTDKDKINEKIAELEKMIGEKRVDRSNNNAALEPVEREWRILVEEKELVEKNSHRLEDLILVLSGGDPEINYKGTKQRLSAISIPTNTVHDYSSSLTSTTYEPGTTNAAIVLAKAEGYLNSIKDPNRSLNIPFRKTKLTHFNQRTYQSRRILLERHNNIAYGVNSALREFGLPKLEKVIEASGASDQDELKEIAKRLVHRIHWHEEIANQEGFHYVKSKETVKGWTTKYDAWQRSLLNKKPDEFPYVPAVDWEKVCKLMTSLFPLIDNNDISKGLQNKDYLTKNSDSNYLAPKDKTKGWSETIQVYGFSNVPVVDVAPSITMSKYAQESSTPNVDLIKDQLKGGDPVPSNFNFASIVQLWYEAFEPFMDFSANKWKTTIMTNDTYETDYELENSRNELRFCKTVRELLKALEISKEDNDFDDYLLDIADKTEKKAVDFETQKSLSTMALVTAGCSSSYWEFFKNYKEGWNEDYSEDRAKQLARKRERVQAQTTVYNARIKAQENQMAVINERNALVEFEINKLKRQIDDLKSLKDFKDKPLPDKKDDFNKLYDKKTSQGGKWLVTDIRQMLRYLEAIKETMTQNNEVDNYKSEGFETKENELNGILSDIQALDGIISRDFYSEMHVSSDKTPTAAIKAILKKISEGKTTVKLENISEAFKGLEDKVILDEAEKDSYTKIKEAIQDPSKYKPDVPVSDLDGPKLNSALQVSGISDKDINLDSWKKISNFNTEQNIKDLVNKVKADATKFSNFQDYLDTHAYSEAKIAKGDDQWTNFVKKEPKVVIGAILYWADYQDASDSDKKKIIDAIKAVNDSDKADKSDLWETDDSKPEGKKTITKYLYRIKTGRNFDVKKETQAPTPESPDEEVKMSSVKEWLGFGSVGKSLLSYGLISAATCGGVAWYFRDSIKGWWEPKGENEEGSEGDNE
ncbi:MAG: hypothetical protein MRERC_2c115 [Mycoplasmataceae bacterium RC_NB112A]|nr:MAG: hypothetical protein MRERC_2c115 [Mycoplasmataceae bacterium RC_NB112A]